MAAEWAFPNHAICPTSTRPGTPLETWPSTCQIHQAGPVHHSARDSTVRPHRKSHKSIPSTVRLSMSIDKPQLSVPTPDLLLQQVTSKKQVPPAPLTSTDQNCPRECSPGRSWLCSRISPWPTVSSLWRVRSRFPANWARLPQRVFSLIWLHTPIRYLGFISCAFS